MRLKLKISFKTLLNKVRVCNNTSLFGSCYSIIGLFMGLAVSFLLRHKVDHVLRTCFSFVASSGQSSVLDSFFCY